MRKFLVLLSAFCMIAFVGCKKDELEPAETSGTISDSSYDDEGELAFGFDETEEAMFNELFPYSDSDVEEMIAMFTDEELEGYMDMLPFQFDDEPMQVAKKRSAAAGGGTSPFKVIGGVFEFVGMIVGEVFTNKFVDSDCTDETAMILAMLCGKEESVLMLHQVLSKLNKMDQKLDHISSMVSKVNAKLTNQILNDGVDKVQKVIQDRNNRLSDVVANQRKYWRLMSMSIGMIDENGQKTPGYNPEAMLVLSDPSKTPKDSVTLRKDSLVRNRLELFHHYLAKWYKECENKGYRAEDLVKYMTRANNGLSYPWTAAYSGVAITAVPWENEAGSVVNALRAEDAAILGVQVVMEALYSITSRCRYNTGKNLPKNLVRTEINDIQDNLNVLQKFYERFDPTDEKTMATGARLRCTIPGCQIQFVAHKNNVDKNVSLRQKTFREIINEVGKDYGRYPGNSFWGSEDQSGKLDVQWWAFKEAIEKWKAMNIHKDEFNRDTCEMLTLQEVQTFNDYFENKARAEKANNGQTKDEATPLYTTPFVQAVTSHIYPDDKNARLWPDMVFLFPDDSWSHWNREVRRESASKLGLTDETQNSGDIFSGWIDFQMHAMAYEFNINKYSIHRCHYHCGEQGARDTGRQYFYLKTDGKDAHWQSEGKGFGACMGLQCNCPVSFKNLEYKDIYYKDSIYNKHYITNMKLPSPLIKRYDIRQSVINAANAAYKAIRNAEPTEN